MRRRQLLALSGSLLAGSAGCLSASAPEAPAATATQDATTDASATATEPATDAPTTTEYADVSVALDALQPGMVTMTTPDSIGVRDGDDRQYLLLDVSTSGDSPARDSFAFAFDGTDHRPESVDEPWRFWRFEDAEAAFYDADSGEGVLLFELPASAERDGASPALTWPGGEWRPDGAIRKRLLAPTPPLSVTLDVPAEIEPHESPTVSVTVENGGDVPGRFVAGLNRSGPMIAYTPVERISIPVAAGESETWEHTDSLFADDVPDERVGDDEADMTYHLDWAGGDARRGVRYAATDADA